MNPSQGPPRKSVHPKPEAGDGQQSSRSNARALGFVQFVEQLLARCPQAVPVEVRAWLEQSVEPKQAESVGHRKGTRVLMKRWRNVASTLASVILAGKLAGYGPLRLRYACEVALALARRVESLDREVTTKAGRSAGAQKEIQRVAKLRTAALAVITNLIGARDEEKARVRRATGGARSRDRTIESSEALAQELERLMREVPAELARDAGATTELLHALQAAADAASGAAQAHEAQQQAVAEGYDLAHVLKGRLAHELVAMQAAARTARRSDPEVPSLARATATRTRRAKTPKKPGTPPAPPPA